MESMELKLGMHIKENDLIALDNIEIYLDNVTYSFNREHGYSILEGDIKGINISTDKCDIILRNPKKTDCIYRCTSKYKTLHERKVIKSIELITWLLTFLIETWNIDFDELKNIAKECKLFEYIVKNMDYLNSMNVEDIEYELNNYIREHGIKIMSIYLDEYDMTEKFDNITENLLKNLCLLEKMKVYEAVYKLMGSNTFKEYADKYGKETICMYNDNMEEEKESLWVQLRKELGLGS